MTRRSYSGAAQRTKLTTQVGPAETTLVIANPSGWPTGANGPFFVTLSRGTANEEKVLVSSRTAGTLAVAQRGADGTAPLSHPIDAAVEHVWTAVDADESNEHINRTGAVHGTMSSVVGVDDTQTLTNKAISGLNNTLTDLPIGEVVGLAAEQAAQDAATALVQTNLNAEAAARAAADATLANDIGVVAGNLNAEVANRQAADALLLPKAGGAVTGDLSVAGTLTGTGPVLVPAPTVAGHATTKAYVDDKDAAQTAARVAAQAMGRHSWGDANYLWSFSSGGWTLAPGASFLLAVKAGEVYLFNSDMTLVNTAPSPPVALRVSIQVSAVVVNENGMVLPASDSEQVGYDITGIWKAPADGTVEVSTKFSGTAFVKGNGWQSPQTQWARLS